MAEVYFSLLETILRAVGMCKFSSYLNAVSVYLQGLEQRSITDTATKASYTVNRNILTGIHTCIGTSCSRDAYIVSRICKLIMTDSVES